MRDQRPARCTGPWTWPGPSLSARSPTPTESNRLAEKAYSCKLTGAPRHQAFGRAAQPISAEHQAPGTVSAPTAKGGIRLSVELEGGGCVGLRHRSPSGEVAG